MRTDVTFDSAGIQIAGHLYTPDGAHDGARPAIVVGHPGSGVKEQAAGLYARRLSERGFVTVAFDAAYQGESGGLPRGLEDPGHRVEDIRSAVSFLSARDEVDPERIGLLGICASGGYALAATASDHRIKAVGTVSAVDIARQFRVGADGTQDPSVLSGMLDAAATARAAEARGAGPQTFSLFPESEEEARQAGQHVFEGYEYYCTPRAMHPRSAKALTWSSIERVVTFDALSAVALIAPRPLLLIAGREAVTSWMSVAAFQQATGPKEFVWIDGATHNDLYDRPQHVGPAVERLTGFFGRNLAASAARAVASA